MLSPESWCFWVMRVSLVRSGALVVGGEGLLHNSLNFWLTFVSLGLGVGLHQLANNLNFATFFGELECVRLEVHQNLFDPLLVRFYNKILIFDSCMILWIFDWLLFFLVSVFLLVASFGSEAYEFGGNADVPGLRLILLNWNYILHSSLNVERLNVLYEFARLQLGKPQDVLHVQQ